MNYNKKSVKDIEVNGKKVLLRCDFNVPQDKDTRAITDDKRIRAALPTIQYLLDNGAAVICCSHLGKPKKVENFREVLTLAPVAKRLGELLNMNVVFATDTIGPDAKAKAAALQPGQILLLENTRFDPREEKNDPEFAKELASMAEIFVSDAFGTVHRCLLYTSPADDRNGAMPGLYVFCRKRYGRSGCQKHPPRSRGRTFLRVDHWPAGKNEIGHTGQVFCVQRACSDCRGRSAGGLSLIHI